MANLRSFSYVDTIRLMVHTTHHSLAVLDPFVQVQTDCLQASEVFHGVPSLVALQSKTDKNVMNWAKYAADTSIRLTRCLGKDGPRDFCPRPANQLAQECCVD